ncbi:MAG: hypothetical protein WBB26_13535 [Saprospiraceae bacterium]
MDFTQVRKWMLKMNNIMDLYEKEEGFTSTEKDLLLDYNKRIKDHINSLQTYIEEVPPIISTPPAAVPTPLPISHIQPTELEVQKTNTPELIAAQKLEEPKGEFVDKPSIQFNTDTTFSENHNVLFDHLDVHDLAEKLTITPIKDLRTAFGLNERILAQNDLFEGNKTALDDFLSTVNNFSNFAEARSFLSNQIITKYKWTQEDKLPIAKKVIKSIYRRFL